MFIQAHINKYIFKTKVLQTANEIKQGMMGKQLRVILMLYYLFYVTITIRHFG